jgi:hypothetical protein
MLRLHTFPHIREIHGHKNTIDRLAGLIDRREHDLKARLLSIYVCLSCHEPSYAQSMDVKDSREDCVALRALITTRCLWVTVVLVLCKFIQTFDSRSKVTH